MTIRRLGRSGPGRDRHDALLGSVFGRSLHDERRGITGWVLGIAALSVWLLAMYPTIRDNGDFTKLLESYPKALRKLFSLNDFTSGPGYVRSELFSFTVPVLLSIVAVLWGSDAVAGEEERHTLDLLLANPISRRRLVAEKWAAVVLAILIVSAVLALVLTIGAPVVSLDIGWWRLMAPVVACAMLAVLFASLSLAIGAATGHRGLARGGGAALAVSAYLVSSLAELVSWLRPFRVVSPWYHAFGVDPVGAGLSLPHIAVLVVASLAFAVFAAVAFDRRDLLQS